MLLYIKLSIGNDDSIRLWKFESFIPLDQIKSGLLKTIHSSKYFLRGDVNK